MQEPRLPSSAVNLLVVVSVLVAVLAILGILAVFYLPATIGPYSAVHGPATAFRSVQHSRNVRVVIAFVFLPAATVSLFLILTCKSARTELVWSKRLMATFFLIERNCVRLC
jgi:hypothetical protein